MLDVKRTVYKLYHDESDILRQLLTNSVNI